jgi:hypothetical protein
MATQMLNILNSKWWFRMFFELSFVTEGTTDKVYKLYTLVLWDKLTKCVIFKIIILQFYYHKNFNTSLWFFWLQNFYLFFILRAALYRL